MAAKITISLLISTLPVCLVHGSDAGDYLDPDLFEDASVEVLSDGVQAGDLSLPGITEQAPSEDSLPPIRQVFPGMNVSYLVESAKRHSPKDFESRRAWYTPVMHVNGSSVVSNEYNSVSCSLLALHHGSRPGAVVHEPVTAVSIPFRFSPAAADPAFGKHVEALQRRHYP